LRTFGLQEIFRPRSMPAHCRRDEHGTRHPRLRRRKFAISTTSSLASSSANSVSAGIRRISPVLIANSSRS
jgi:hypothetical protein